MSLDFQKMGLPAPLQKSLNAIKFVNPTPIQEKAIPLALAGKDIIGSAQTGTGKTAAFCIPIVAKLIENPKRGALILAPTRELAQQIADVVRKLTMPVQKEIKMCLLVGGTDMYRQYRDLKQNPAIIIATPGRLSDHLRRKSVNLNRVDILVLDEGDRMLDMGFEPQINEILKFMKPEKQTMLFSATMPPKMQKLAKTYMKDPEHVAVGEESKPAAKINHKIIQTTRYEKDNILLDQLNSRSGSILIFVNTQVGTERMTDYLNEYGFGVTQIHGGRSQGQRNTALKGFREGRFRILVATDVAARGLDVPHIEHVINYEIPRQAEDYVHRIGRTARAGKMGEAICLLSQEDRFNWNRIARLCDLEMIERPRGQRPQGEDARGGEKRRDFRRPKRTFRGASGRNSDNRSSDNRSGDGKRSGPPVWKKRKEDGARGGRPEKSFSRY
jgi:superfamily II DNA/RNA helicase